MKKVFGKFLRGKCPTYCDSSSNSYPFPLKRAWDPLL